MGERLATQGSVIRAFGLVIQNSAITFSYSALPSHNPPTSSRVQSDAVVVPNVTHPLARRPRPRCSLSLHSARSAGGAGYVAWRDGASARSVPPCDRPGRRGRAPPSAWRQMLYNEHGCRQGGRQSCDQWPQHLKAAGRCPHYDNVTLCHGHASPASRCATALGATRAAAHSAQSRHGCRASAFPSRAPCRSPPS
jgi:hypothetical protein